MCTVVDQFGKTVAAGTGKFTCIDGDYNATGPIIEHGKMKWSDRNHFTYTADRSTNPNQIIGREWPFARAD